MKSTIISIAIAGLFIFGAVMLVNFDSTSETNTESINNVVVEGDTQIISISARGGYSPKVTNAKAGMPTILRVETRGTYDCSASLVIPEIEYKEFLDPNGVEEITLPPQEVGAVVTGLCSMGMYSFSVNFN